MAEPGRQGSETFRRLSRRALELALYDMSSHWLSVFHAGRCAICGRAVGRIVEDHCHDTGQVRGELCQGCNVAEGRSSLPIYVRYRRIHPAAILDVHEMYTGAGWTNGWSWMTHGESSRSGRRREPTPWPAWDLATLLEAA